MKLKQLIIVAVIVLCQTIKALEAVVQVSPDNVSSESSMTLTVMFDESLGRGGSIRINIQDDPNSLATESHDNIPLEFRLDQASNLECSIQSGSATSIASCQISNSRQLIIGLSDSGFLLAGDSITFNIENCCINPSSLYYADKSLSISTISAEGIFIEEKSSYLLLQSLTPAVIKQASVVLANDVLGATDEKVEVFFTLQNNIPYQGSIQLKFPKRLEIQQPNEGFLRQEWSITGLSANGMQFNLNDTRVQETPESGQLVAISGFIPQASSRISQGSQIQITIDGFNNPVTLADNFVKITTFDNFGYEIEETSQALLKISTPASIIEATVSRDAGSWIINQNTALRIDFSSPIPLNQGCVITLDIPNSLATNLQASVKYIYVQGLFGALKILPFSVSASKVTISNACNYFLPNDQVGTIKVKYLKNPSSVRDTESFKLTILDNSGGILAVSSTSSSLSLSKDMFEPSSFQYLQIVPSNQTVLAQNDLLVTTQLSSILDVTQNPSIKITIPGALIIGDVCEFEAFSEEINSGNAKCEIDQIKRTITVKNFTIVTESIGPSNGAISFRLKNAVKNTYGAKQAIGTFIVETVVNGDQVVDRSSIENAFEIKAGSLYDAQFNFSPDESSAVKPKTSIKFINQHVLVSGSRIDVIFPIGELVLQNEPITCVGDASMIDEQQCKVTLVNDQFILSTTTSGNAEALSTFEIVVLNMFKRAPRFQGKMSQASMIRTSISGQVVDESALIYPQVAVAQSFGSCELQLGSNVNSAQSSFDLQILNTTNLFEGDYLKFSMTNQVYQTLVADPSQVLCDAPLYCKAANSMLTVQNLTTSSLQSLSLQISGIINPPSTRQVGPIEVQLLDVQNRTIQRCKNSTFVQTQLASDTNSVRIIQSNTQANAPSNFTITVEQNFAENDIIPWVKLTLPDCIKVEAGKQLQILDHSSNSLLQFTQYSDFDVVFKLHGGINFFTLLNLVNPTEACLFTSLRLSFEFYTFEDEQLQFKIAQRLTGLEPSLSCKNPCATCKSVDKAFCHTCVDPETMWLLTDSGKCRQDIQACPSGYYQKSSSSINGNQCFRCPSGCDSCSDQTGVCLTCSESFLLNRLDSVCIPRAQCDTAEGWLVKEGACHKCSSECQTCGPVSELQCTTCKDPSLLLFQGECVAECPEGFEQSSSFKECKAIPPLNNLQSVRQLLSQTTDVVIEQQHPSVVIAHFPATLVFFLPFILWRKCHETGRCSLSTREVSLIVFGSMEYLGTVFLLFKCLLALNNLEAEFDLLLEHDQAQDVQKLLPNPSIQSAVILWFLIFLILAWLAVHHLTNEFFYRQVLKIWEANIQEDFKEEFTGPNSRGCCTCFCGVESLTMMRYFNFREWISLWRKTGWIIPESQQLVRDSIALSFVKLSKKVTALNLFVKYMVLVAFVAYLKWFADQKSVFLPNQVIEYTVGEESAYRKYIQSVINIHEFLCNQIFEVILMGTCANILLQKWLKEGDLESLSEHWDEFDSSLSKSSSSSSSSSSSGSASDSSDQRRRRRSSSISSSSGDSSIRERPSKSRSRSNSPKSLRRRRSEIKENPEEHSAQNIDLSEVKASFIQQEALEEKHVQFLKNESSLQSSHEHSKEPAKPTEFHSFMQRPVATEFDSMSEVSSLANVEAYHRTDTQAAEYTARSVGQDDHDSRGEMAMDSKRQLTEPEE